VILPWTEVRRSVVYESYRRGIAEVVFQHPFSGETTFSIKCDPQSVAVVAVTDRGQILVTRQYRPGPGQVMYELPGGFIEKEEDVLAAARRELSEETGYGGELEHVGQCYFDAYSNGIKNCVICRDARLRTSPAPDDEEQIDVTSLSVTDFRRVLRQGGLTDVDIGYMALDALGLL
jgi:ADP-ribose pyrophosphatase